MPRPLPGGSIIAGLVPSIAVAVALALPATPPNTGAQCAREVTAQGFVHFAGAVWDQSRWQRGDPPQRIIRVNHHMLRCASSPAARKAMKRIWARDRHRFYAHRHYCRSGTVVEGRVSVFGGGRTASGVIASATPGLALNIDPSSEPGGWNNSTTASWIRSHQRFWVDIDGHRAILPVIDAGPASWTGRSIDVTEPGAIVLGLSVSAFPTDSLGIAQEIPRGCLR